MSSIVHPFHFQIYRREGTFVVCQGGRGGILQPEKRVNGIGTRRAPVWVD